MTTLVKRAPLTELDGMERWLNSMLSGVGFGPVLRPRMPAADVYVSDGKYVIELEVPGFVEKELSIELAGRLLTITGVHEETEEEAARTFRLHERLENEFERSFMLPPEVDVEKVTSTFEGGVLKVFAPVPAATTSRKVPIAAA